MFFILYGEECRKTVGRGIWTQRGGKMENRNMKKAKRGSQGGLKGLEKNKDQTEGRS